MKIILVTKKGIRLPDIPLSSFFIIIVLINGLLTWFLTQGFDGTLRALLKALNHSYLFVKDIYFYINSTNIEAILTDVYTLITNYIKRGDEAKEHVSLLGYFDILTIIAISVALIYFIKIGCVTYSLLRKNAHNRPEKLFVKKFMAELETFSIDGTSSFQDKNQQGCINEQKLEQLSSYLTNKNGAEKDFPEENANEQTDNALAYNKTIWKSEWNYWDNAFEESYKIRTYSTDKSSFFEERKKALKDLKETIKDNNCGLKFYVANIQPSIILAAENVIKLSNTNATIKTVVETHTGPHTVSEAFKEKLRNREVNDTTIICFAAPLAAFCTYQHEQYSRKSVDAPGVPSFFAYLSNQRLKFSSKYSRKKEKYDPTKYFVPVTTAIEETQEILFVEDFTRTPHKKPKIYYYNNSTSEECIAKLDQDLLDIYDLRQINDFDTYKELLSETYADGHSLEPGDGVALWDPLIDYYIDKKVARGLLRPHNQRLLYQKSSMINLYADKCIVNISKEHRALQINFMRALILEMRFIQLQYIDNKLPEKFFELLKTGSCPNHVLRLLKKSHAHSFKNSIE